jgi:hypothetical protein
MEATLARKLQLKPGQVVRALHVPEKMELDMPEAGVAEAAGGHASAPATLVFVRTHDEAEAHTGAAVEAALADELSWVAYPKAGKLGTDLNRDSLAAFMTARGVRPVRQVAIDDTWSALRFRPPSP